MDDYSFKLYLAGQGRRAAGISESVKETLNSALHGGYRLDVIDVLSQPGNAVDDGVIVTPTIILKTPLPERRAVGSLEQQQAVLSALGLTEH